MINKILVPLDGSATAEAVLPLAIEIASAAEAEVLLVSAVTPVAVWDQTASAIKWEAEEAAAGDYVKSKEKDLAGQGLKVQSRVDFGEAAEVIMRIAKDEGVALIAMTTHGRSGVARWIIGSVAAKVLHATHAPLLLVRPPADGRHSKAPTLKKLLVPLDGSELSISVLPFAADFAKSLGASIVLFQAVFEPVMTYPGAEAILDDTVLREMEDGARKFLASAAGDLKAKGVRADAIATIGNATDGIVWAAEREGADLIVMSTHGRSGIGRIVLGSVADSVVRRTSLPVILVGPTNEGRNND